MAMYIVPPRPMRPSKRLGTSSPCHGALSNAAMRSAIQKCTTFGVLNVPEVSLLAPRGRKLAVNVTTININPVRVAAAVPTIL